MTQDGFVKPDLVAPGTTIVATRDAGSTIDSLHPDAVVDGDYFKGTGTSQAGAIVSGVAALLYQANPSLRPSAVKSILMGSTFRASQYRTGGGVGARRRGGRLLEHQQRRLGERRVGPIARRRHARGQPRAVPRPRRPEPRRPARPRDG